MSALCGCRVSIEPEFYTAGGDTIKNVFWSALGGLIVTVAGTNKICRVYNSLAYPVTAAASAMFPAPNLYDAEDVEEIIVSGGIGSVVMTATTAGELYEHTVAAGSDVAIVTTPGGRSRGRLFRLRGQDGYHYARRVTATGVVELYEVTTPGMPGGMASVSVAAGFTWPDGTYVNMDRDPTSGERWLSASKVGYLSSGSYVVADTGIGSGYVSRGLTWCQSEGVF